MALRCRFRHFLLPLREVFVRRLGFLLVFARQVRMAREGFAHPDGGDLHVGLFRHDGGALQCGFAALCYLSRPRGGAPQQPPVFFNFAARRPSFWISGISAKQVERHSRSLR